MFYCLDCDTLDKKLNYDDKKHRNVKTWSNTRDGYGRAIYHIVCPKCGNPLSGFVNSINANNEEEIEYYKYVLSMYQKEDGYLYFGENSKFKTIGEFKEQLLKDLEDRLNKQDIIINSILNKYVK